MIVVYGERGLESLPTDWESHMFQLLKIWRKKEIARILGNLQGNQ